jgi:hypothetical protein
MLAARAAPTGRDNARLTDAYGRRWKGAYRAEVKAGGRRQLTALWAFALKPKVAAHGSIAASAALMRNPRASALERIAATA